MACAFCAEGVKPAGYGKHATHLKKHPRRSFSTAPLPAATRPLLTGRDVPPVGCDGDGAKKVCFHFPLLSDFPNAKLEALKILSFWLACFIGEPLNAGARHAAEGGGLRKDRGRVPRLRAAPAAHLGFDVCLPTTAGLWAFGLLCAFGGASRPSGPKAARTTQRQSSNW